MNQIHLTVIPMSHHLFPGFHTSSSGLLLALQHGRRWINNPSQYKPTCSFCNLWYSYWSCKQKTKYISQAYSEECILGSVELFVFGVYWSGFWRKDGRIKVVYESPGHLVRCACACALPALRKELSIRRWYTLYYEWCVICHAHESLLRKTRWCSVYLWGFN